MSEAAKTTLTDGSPVTPDHRELRPYGQQKGYVVLTEQGTLAITIQGVDHVISLSRSTKAEKLLIEKLSGSND